VAAAKLKLQQTINRHISVFCWFLPSQAGARSAMCREKSSSAPSKSTM
jgi:hypothetical protein